ncbi:AraC family transcriptional regulator [Streptomyces kronopolitis]|uniref:AraC family transcriptional regulator n=1 Tax=Streptomyces kronopolitis TaxID=1612435 RepID=UPI00341BA14B
MQTSSSWSQSAPGTNRSTSATIQPSILRHLVLVCDARGCDLRPALGSVDLSPALLRSARLRVSYRQGSAVVREALRLTGDSGLGLAVGAAQHLTAWGLLGFALLASDTLQDAVELGVRYQNLSGAMVVWSAASGDEGFALRADLPDPGLDPAVGVFLVDEALSSVLTVARLAVGATCRPRLVELAFPRPRHAARYADLFGCRVRFGAAHNRCVFAPEWARRAMPARDAWALATTVELLDQAMSSRREQQDLLEVLEISIAQSLPDVPSFAEQARRHATSERTLRRRLAECGTTYEVIVDGVRRERAEQLLGRSLLTLREVARRVGFADERTLRRAVNRWHGMTPLELRRTRGVRRADEEA